MDYFRAAAQNRSRITGEDNGDKNFWKPCIVCPKKFSPNSKELCYKLKETVNSLEELS